MPGLRTECFASQSIWYHRGVTSPCTRLTVTLTLTSSWMKYTVPWPPPVRISCSSAPTSTSLSRLVFYFWFYNPRARHREVFEGHSGSLGKSCLGIYSFQWQILSLFIWVSVVLVLSTPKSTAPEARTQHDGGLEDVIPVQMVGYIGFYMQAIYKWIVHHFSLAYNSARTRTHL